MTIQEMVQNMTEIAEKLKIELSQLSIQDRAELAYFLIHSLEESIDDDVEVGWDRELTRRLDEILSGKAIGESSNQVFSKLREKYS
jgi:putative addiction module component (TIGR02574 family)